MKRSLGGCVERKSRGLPEALHDDALAALAAYNSILPADYD
jgi:hypothetical protein